MLSISSFTFRLCAMDYRAKAIAKAKQNNTTVWSSKEIPIPPIIFFHAKATQTLQKYKQRHLPSIDPVQTKNFLDISLFKNKKKAEIIPMLNDDEQYLAKLAYAADLNGSQELKNAVASKLPPLFVHSTNDVGAEILGINSLYKLLKFYLKNHKLEFDRYCFSSVKMQELVRALISADYLGICTHNNSSSDRSTDPFITRCINAITKKLSNTINDELTSEQYCGEFYWNEIPHHLWLKISHSLMEQINLTSSIENISPIEFDMILVNPYAHSISCNSNNQLIKLSRYNPKAELWDLDTRHRSQLLSGHGRAITSASFNSNGDKIVTSSHDKTAKIWNAQNGQCIMTLAGPRGHKRSVCTAEFDHSGSRIVTASKDFITKVWDANSGECLHTFEEQDYSPIFEAFAHFDSQGKKILAALGGIISILDAATGKCIGKIGQPDWIEDKIITAQFNHQGNQIVTTSTDGFASMWDASSGKCIYTLGFIDSFDNQAISAHFSPLDDKILVLYDNCHAKIWDAKKGTWLCTLGPTNNHKRTSMSGFFTPSGDKVITTAHDTVKIWNAQNGQCLKTLIHSTPVNSVAITPDESYIITAANDYCMFRLKFSEFLTTEKNIKKTLDEQSPTDILRICHEAVTTCDVPECLKSVIGIEQIDKHTSTGWIKQAINWFRGKN